MQIQADVIDRPVRRKMVSELSAAGAAWMAASALGIWSVEGPEAIRQWRDELQPQADAAASRTLLDGWASALRRANLPD